MIQGKMWCLTDILAYMEIIPGMNDKRDHIYQILSAGISRPDLRDEIYCQLCKQTNFNPDKYHT